MKKYWTVLKIGLHDRLVYRGAGLVIVGAATGTAGVEVWYTTAQEAATTANSYQIATVNGVNTGDVANTDFTLIL